MKDNKTPFILRKDVTIGISIVLGGIMGGLLCSIGQNTGEYHGIKDTDENWRTAIKGMIDEMKNKPEEKEA